MRSWLQLPWTFEGLWGTAALFSRNAAACFQPAFILQSSVSWIEVLHNRILHNELDKSGAVHRKSPCKGTDSGALTPIFTLQQMEGYLEVEHWRWRYCQDLHPGVEGKGAVKQRGYAGKKLPDHSNSILGLNDQWPCADTSLMEVEGFIKNCCPRGICSRRDVNLNLRWNKKCTAIQADGGITEWPDRLVCICMVKPGEELPGVAERILFLRFSGWDP